LTKKSQSDIQAPLEEWGAVRSLTLSMKDGFEPFQVEKIGDVTLLQRRKT
jgi:hypothetical protein